MEHQGEENNKKVLRREVISDGKHFSAYATSAASFEFSGRLLASSRISVLNTVPQ